MRASQSARKPFVTIHRYFVFPLEFAKGIFFETVNTKYKKKQEKYE